MNRRPWTFGVSSPRVQTGAEWREFAQRAEHAGYDVAYVADHTSYVDPLLPLVTMAEATSRLRVGTLVLNIGFWHPLLLARSAATLQSLTGGRFELGLGAGWAKLEHDSLGIAFWSAGERVERLAEFLRLTRAALHGTAVEPTAHYPVQAVEAPATPPGEAPTMIVGGFGERLLRSCAAYADVIQLTGLADDRAGALRVAGNDVAGFAKRVEWIRDAAGERFDSIELSLLLQHVRVVPAGNDPGAEAARIATKFGIDADALRRSPLFAVGTIDEVAAKLSGLRDELGVTHICLFAASLHEFAPILERLRAEDRFRMTD